MKTLLLGMLMCICNIISIHAQSEIQFTISKSKQKELPENVVNALDLRLKQIFNRNSAASANQYNVFEIEPTLEISDALSTEGLIQEVSIAQGELTLIAKNAIDETMYYSMVIPLKGSSLGGEEKAMKTMISNIKITNTAFTRFIRTARQKIQDYYATNCGFILQKAQGLYEQKKYQEAISYLSAISETLPCYEQASVLLSELAQYSSMTTDTVVIERIVEKPIEIEKVVEKPVIIEKVVEKPVVVERPVVVEKPTPQVNTPKLNYNISISANDLDVKVLKCYGNEIQRRITIELQVTNQNNTIDSGTVSFESAYTSDGMPCKNRGALGDRFNTSYGVKLPPQIKLKQNFYVLEVSEKIGSFSYVELHIRNAKVVIRDLPVEW